MQSLNRGHMYYAIYTTDVENSLAIRTEHRGAHRARIQELTDQGRILTAGPFPNVDSTDPGTAGFSGSLIVAEFTTLDAAQQWANEDPYTLNGVYQQVIVKPYLNVFP